MLYPNGLLLRGSEQDTAWAHGLVVEALTDAPAYQTFDPGAQDIERQIRSVWSVFHQNPAAHVGAPALEARLDDSRVGRLREAISRMIDRPERVAAEPGVPARILTAAASAVVATAIKKVLERGIQRALHRHEERPARLEAA